MSARCGSVGVSVSNDRDSIQTGAWELLLFTVYLPSRKEKQAVPLFVNFLTETTPHSKHAYR